MLRLWGAGKPAKLFVKPNIKEPVAQAVECVGKPDPEQSEGGGLSKRLCVNPAQTDCPQVRHNPAAHQKS
jgi:hypothetical protein